jgi:pimeloyl-ACP methyl ester carboxylesterase
MTLHVDETGTLGAPSIVFLHGVGTSGWMWWRQTAAFSDYHCLNVDLPGHGKSNAVRWVSFADAADQVAAIIRERATEGRAHVVGLSLGGHVALLLLERHAALVERALVSGVTAAPMPNRRLLKPQVWMMSAVRKSRWLLNMQARALGLPPEQQAAFIDNYLAMSMSTYEQIAAEAAYSSVAPALAQVHTPTLLIAGSRETAIIRDAVRVIAALMPNAQGRLAPNVGHGWNVEAPEMFNGTMRAWVMGGRLPEVLRQV